MTREQAESLKHIALGMLPEDQRADAIELADLITIAAADSTGIVLSTACNVAQMQRIIAELDAEAAADAPTDRIEVDEH